MVRFTLRASLKRRSQN